MFIFIQKQARTVILVELSNRTLNLTGLGKPKLSIWQLHGQRQRDKDTERQRGNKGFDSMYFLR